MSHNNIKFVRIGEFDRSKVVICPPKNQEFTSKTGEKNTTTRSKVLYKDFDDTEKELYLELPETFSFGVNLNHVFQKEKIPENVTGVQTCYMLTGKDNVDDPTEPQKYTEKVFREIEELTWEAMKTEAKRPKGERRIPQASINSANSAMVDNDYTLALKPIFQHPNKPETKIPNTAKPKQAYFKLKTYGKGTSMKCATVIHGPGNMSIDYNQLIGTNDKRVMGIMKPVIKWEGLYWGAHGQTGRGVSPTLTVSEMTFTKQQARSTVSFLTNNDPLETDDVPEENETGVTKEVDDLDLSDDEEDDDEDDVFASPVVVQEQPKALTIKEKRALKKKAAAK